MVGKVLAVETRYMPKAQPKRCSWVDVDQGLMREYHDREWVVQTHDDRTHFEFLILEAAQGRPRQNRWTTLRQIPATTRESDAFSKDLKRRGFSFVGSTVMYAHMQAVGMVNDHLVDCFRYRDVRRLGRAANDPTSRLARGSLSKKR